MIENQIFLSYSLADSASARRIVRAIEERGWPISWERYAEPDAIASLALREALSAASCVVVLWSERSIGSEDVVDEAKIGRASGILVQAVLDDDVQVPMPFTSDDRTRLNDEWSVTELVRQVERVLQRGAANAQDDVGEPEETVTPRRDVTEPGSAMAGVRFTVTAPPYVKPGEVFSIDVWAHRPEDLERIPVHYSQARSTSGSTLAARLHVDGLVVDKTDESIFWEDGIGSGVFRVEVPETASVGSRSGVIGIHSMGLQIARVRFNVQVGETTAPREIIPSRQENHRRAVAAYALEDRQRVMARVRAFEKGAPDVEIFEDTLALRSSDDGLSRLLELFSIGDVFYLFWSENAAASSELEREWRYALRVRGIDFIDLVPLSPLEEAPPPPELAMLHGGAIESTHESPASAPGPSPPEPEAR